MVQAVKMTNDIITIESALNETRSMLNGSSIQSDSVQYFEIDCDSKRVSTRHNRQVNHARTGKICPN